jgi:hypothetical protein
MNARTTTSGLKAYSKLSSIGAWGKSTMKSYRWNSGCTKWQYEFLLSWISFRMSLLFK